MAIMTDSGVVLLNRIPRLGKYPGFRVDMQVLINQASCPIHAHRFALSWDVEDGRHWLHDTALLI